MSNRPGLALGALVALCACPTPHRIAPAPAPPWAEEEPEGSDTAGVVHVVRRGQTLYRILLGVGAAAWKCAISRDGIEVASPIPIVA